MTDTKDNSQNKKIKMAKKTQKNGWKPEIREIHLKRKMESHFYLFIYLF